MTKNLTTNLLNIESLINSHDARLVGLNKELGQYKEMLKNIMDNNDEYSKANEEAVKLSKVKTLAKQKVLKSPAALPLIDKITDAQSQIKELRVALSDYLSQYVNLSGTNQIEGPDGVIRQIVYTAKLVKKFD